MKYLFAFIFLFSSHAYADNYLRVSELNSAVKTSYGLLSDCTAGGFVCVQIDGFDLEVVDYVDGVLVVSQAKLDAKNARIAAEAAAEAARLNALNVALAAIDAYLAKASPNTSDLQTVAKAMANFLKNQRK